MVVLGAHLWVSLVYCRSLRLHGARDPPQPWWRCAAAALRRAPPTGGTPRAAPARRLRRAGNPGHRGHGAAHRRPGAGADEGHVGADQRLTWRYLLRPIHASHRLLIVVCRCYMYGVCVGWSRYCRLGRALFGAGGRDNRRLLQRRNTTSTSAKTPKLGRRIVVLGLSSVCFG